VEYRFTSGLDNDFAVLCGELDASIDELVGNKFDREPYVQYNQRDDIRDVIIAYNQSELVGCASYKKYDKETAEIKRVFVRTVYREQGIAKKMMEKLESRAKTRGYKAVVLETGEVLIASMSLYKTLGYKVILNYGQYVGMSDSVCMKKYL